MKVIIRLYRVHDMDLITLYKNPRFDFRYALLKALEAYADKRVYLIASPPTSDISGCEFKSRYRIELNLDEVKHAGIIEWLKGIKKLYRTAAVKSVMRGCIIGTVAYGCMENDEDRRGNEDLRKRIKQVFPSLYDAPLKKKYRIKKNTEKDEVCDLKAKIKELEEELTKAKEKEPETENPSVIYRQEDVTPAPDITGFDADEASDDFDMFGDINKMLGQFT